MTTLLQDYAARVAETRPDALAVTMGDERVTYGELVARSDRLAAQLVAAGCEPGDRVGLLIPKRPSAVVAIHAVLKAGGVYVPLDPDSPAQRIGRIVADAEPRLLITAPEAAERLDALAELLPLPPVWSVETEPVAGERVQSVRARGDWDVDGPAPAVRVGADEAAHLLFTSGSTGQPKGVVITHRNVAAFVEWGVGTFGIGADDRLSGHAPLHFDLSTWDMFASFAAGAELHMVPPRLGVDARGLARLIREHELTHWFSVPSVLTFLAKFDAVAHDDFPALRRIWWAGEALPMPVMTHWMRRLPHVEFTNLYGPTEVTIASSFWRVPHALEDEATPIPIGVACDGEELLVLDDELRATPVGEIGEICIAGVGVSPGYWHDEQKTAAAFVADPRAPESGRRIYRSGDLGRIDAEGLLHFVGRADSQVKSRGYRIELGEVEAALNAVDGVGECAVVGVEAEGDDFGGVAICAAYASDAGLEPAAARRLLAGALPSYMLPARWLVLDVLPKNQNGKTDRPVLRERFKQQMAERGGQRA